MKRRIYAAFFYVMSFRQKTFPIYKNSGFTLVELIVVILIIGILSISIAPRFFGVSSYEERRALNELLTALRHTQQMAMNRGGEIRFVLTANHFTVELTDGTQLRSPDGLRHSTCVTPTCYKKSFEGVSASISPAGPIIYDGLGKPNSGFTISIGSKKIQVETETGYAHQI